LTNAAPFADFQRHRTRDDVAAGQILGRRRVALHETLAFGVGEIAAFAARALGDQHARAVDAGRVELHEFHVLQRQAGTQHHAAAVAGAGVGRGGGEIARP
jgi:ribosomal protein L27